MSPDLSLKKHASAETAACSPRLRQISHRHHRHTLCGPVDLEFAAGQPSKPSNESHPQTSTGDSLLKY